MQDEIKAAQPGTIVWDRGESASVAGLHLRVTRDARAGTIARRWFFYYRTRAGAQRRPKVGEFPQVKLAEARKRALAIQCQVSAGDDPSQTWKEARAEKTVADLWTAVKADYYGKARFQDSKWAKTAAWIYGKHLGPEFGSMRLSEVTTTAVRKWHAKLDYMPYGANRALSILKKLFNWAIMEEWRPQGSNPAVLVKPFDEASRERYATPEELARIGAILLRDAPERPAAVAFLLLLMLSGSRPIAIEQATWDQLTVFEQDGKRYGLLVFWGKSSSKTQIRERVVLPPEAMAVIDGLPRIAGKTITGIKAPREYWQKVKTEAGCPDLRMRDSRRTFATVGMTDGIPMDQIGTALNHADTNTTAVYARLMPRTQIAVANRIGGSVWQQLTAPQKEKTPAAPEDSEGHPNQ